MSPGWSKGKNKASWCTVQLHHWSEKKQINSSASFNYRLKPFFPSIFGSNASENEIENDCVETCILYTALWEYGNVSVKFVKY